MKESGHLQPSRPVTFNGHYSYGSDPSVCINQDYGCGKGKPRTARWWNEVKHGLLAKLFKINEGFFCLMPELVRLSVSTERIFFSLQPRTRATLI